MANIFESYLPKIIVEIEKLNTDSITINTNYFSPQGDSYVLEKRTLSPVLIQTTQSLNELKPVTSSIYPYKIVTPLDFDGSTIVISPSIQTFPTASQSYYAPIYFERYNEEVMRSVDKTFFELTTGVAPVEEIGLE